MLVKEHKIRLNKSQKGYDELNDLAKKLYESFATDRIPENHFEKLIKG